MELDTKSKERSYHFGRLLAVLEQVEKITYDRKEGRETNAIRMQSVFVQRPLYAWRIIEERLIPYFSKLSPGSRKYYKDIIGEITNMLPGPEDPTLGKKLDDIYLLGYYHQRSALFTNKKDVEENQNESVEK